MQFDPIEIEPILISISIESNCINIDLLIWDTHIKWGFEGTIYPIYPIQPIRTQKHRNFNLAPILAWYLNINYIHIVNTSILIYHSLCIINFLAYTILIFELRWCKCILLVPYCMPRMRCVYCRVVRLWSFFFQSLPRSSLTTGNTSLYWPFIYSQLQFIYNIYLPLMCSNKREWTEKN